MGLVQTANDQTVSLRKQTTETDITTTPTIDFPIFSGVPEPKQTIDIVNVTDASATQGDPYKKPDSHHEAQITAPAFDLLTGMAFNALYPTDTFTADTPTSGVGRHVLSGAGSGSTAWQTLYSQQSFAGGLKETFEAAQFSSVSISADNNGGPATLGFSAIGKRATAATTINAGSSIITLASGFYTATGGTLQYEADNATPVTETNIQAFTVVVDRGVTAQPTADSVSVSLLSLGKVVPSGTMRLLWTKWDEYRATYYGAVAGTAPSATIVYGSVKFSLPHSTNANLSLVIQIDKAMLEAGRPQPSPDGGPLIVPITIRPAKPASGDHIKVTVFNTKNTVYA